MQELYGISIVYSGYLVTTREMRRNDLTRFNVFIWL